MPSIVSVYPNRIAITPERVQNMPRGYSNSDIAHSLIDFNVKLLARKYCEDMLTFTDNLSKPNHPFLISRSGKNKIRDSITAMYRLSKPRTIQMANGKFIYNFRCSFITLTLPSVQRHSDKEIKKQCLNQFFVEIRKHYGVTNYLWKAELQQNKNIHFHIITDRYIDYQALRRRWNRIVEKLDYLFVYQNKMQSYTLDTYHKMRLSYNPKQTFQNSKQAFEKGYKYNWKNANSVDVKNVRTEQEMATYLSKYITKDVSKDEMNEDLELRQANFGRSWYRSQSLSRLKMSERYYYHDALPLVRAIKALKNTREIIGDYFRVLFFRFSETPPVIKKFIQSILVENANLVGYIFPT